MWVSDYCKLCLIQSRCRDLLIFGRGDLLPYLLKYLGNILGNMRRSEAFTESYTFIKSLLNSEDPYSEIKEKLSMKAIKVAEEVRSYLSESGWDLIKALEFSAASNIIDTSVLGFEPKELKNAIWDTSVLNEFCGIPGDKVVLAPDNAGEFEVDLILAEALINNGYEVTLVVRSKSYEIDVTYDEVVNRALGRRFKVLSVPNNMPPSAYVEDGFLISKGIANAEAYLELNPNIDSIHLFRTKCDILSKIFSVPKNSTLIVSGKTLVNFISNASTSLRSIANELIG
ncbi:MAG: ARMT1-like domain-containing protein [Sulfolobales archaeon]